MKISACIIMRDSARDIGECLESLKGRVDEIVVTDTGSEDDSVDIVRRYTDKVYFFEWRDDFSAAKNFCLEHATGDWIVFLDADEYLSEDTRENLRRVLEDMDEQGYDVLQVRWENVDENHMPTASQNDAYVLRIFRNDPLRRYQNPIHEELKYGGGEKEDKEGFLPPEALRILHKGYSPERMQGKHSRNLSILEQMEERGEKMDLLDFYLAEMYLDAKEYDKAILHAKKSIEEWKRPAIARYEAERTWYFALRDKGADGKEKEEMLLAAMERWPKAPDFYAYYGDLLTERKSYAKAWENFRKAERFMGEFRENFPLETNLLYLRRGRLYTSLADTALKLGKKDQALRYAEMAWDAQRDGKGSGSSQWIPPKSRCVLEFGCDGGETGRAFRAIRPDCRYAAVDDDPARLRKAKEAGLETIEASPAGVDPKEYVPDSADCLLYQDRALHSLTTERLLNHVKCLSPGGQMVFVLENVGYFRYIMDLFAFRGEPFSKSMLTLRELQKLIGNVGLRLLSVDPVYGEEDEEERRRPETLRILNAFAAWCKVRNLSVDTDVWAKRYIVRAVRELPERRLYLQAMVRDPLVSGRVRVEEPNGFLRTCPGVRCRSLSPGAVPLWDEEISRRVVVRQRQSYGSGAKALREIASLRKSGCLILYETDVLPSDWEKGKKCSGRLDVLGAHGVQVPTEALAEALRECNPHVTVFRNELRELPPARDYGGAGPVTIFFGARDRERDWKDILPVLNETAKERGNGIRFRVLSDRAFYDALETEHKEFIGQEAYCEGKLVPHDIYGKTLQESDIALLPLGDTGANRRKSDLAFIESAGHGVVVLASPTVYGASVRDGETGFLYRDPAEFREKLLRLLEDKDRRVRMARAAYDYVRRERLLSFHYEERLEVYRDMLDRWEELDRELGLRLKNIL